MLSLAELNSENKAVTLNDLTMPKKVGPVINSATTSNIAAHAAVLATPEEVMKSYSAISSELTNSASSVTLDQLLNRNRQLDTQQTHSELQRILSDPNIPIEDKHMYTDGYISMMTDRPDSRSLSVMVAQRAALQRQSEDENDETVDSSTFNIGNIEDEADFYRGQIQQKINLTSSLKDQGFFNTAVDFIENMVPFMEPGSVAKTRAFMGDGAGGVFQSLVLLGESKTAVRDAIAAMPLDQRRKVAENLISLVRATGGSITLRPNELNMVNQLNAYLLQDGYMSADRMLDNVFSLVDVVLPAASSLFKGGKGISKSIIAARAAAAEERLTKVVPDAVEQIIDEVLPPKPIAELDTIITGSKGFDKATAEEIANVRNTLGYGLKDGKTIDEIIASDPVFDKFTADELAEFRSIAGSPVARSAEGITDATLEGVRQVVGDLVIDNLPQFDTTVYKNLELVRNEINKVIQRGTITEPRKLALSVVRRVSATLREQGIGILEPNQKKLLLKQVQEESNRIRLSARTTVDQTSLSQTMVSSNAGKARNINSMMEADTTDASANALYGTNRTEAIANDRGPEVVNIDGSVRQKVFMDEIGPTPDSNTVNATLNDKGRIDLDVKEKELQRTQAKDYFRDVNGLVPRTSMATLGRDVQSVKDTSKGVGFDMIYGPKDGGFVKADQGLLQVLLGLKKYGVKESDIEILARQDNGLYAPVKGVPLEDGNYLMRVKYDYEFSPVDTVEHSLLSNSKYSMFETRTSLTDGNAGSLLQHVVPSSAIINRVIFNAASAASDATAKITKRLIKLAHVYADAYKKLPARQKVLVDDYIREANANGIPFSVTNLRIRGFDDNAIEAVRAWKTTTDTMWYFENVDVNKTLRARGWERFVDQTNKTDLVARPVSKHGFTNGGTLYDPDTNTIKNISAKEVEDLYESGGTLAQLKEPLEFGDDVTEHIIVRQNESGYLRRIRDEDETLSYRHGYYPIKYDAPIFIEKKFFKKDGTEYSKAVAIAGNHADSKRILDRLRQTDKTGVYTPRADYKRGTQEFDNAEWSSAVSGGRSAQRVRGKLLVDNVNPISDLSHTYVKSPEESLIQSIRSIASRTAFRDWLETTKKRWIDQNKGLIKEQNGQYLWPESVKAIAANNLEPSNLKVKDAIATWRYVHAMEAGYVNLIDDVSKMFFRNMSDTFGRKGWGWLEKGADVLSTTSPTAYARKKAFRLLLAANPLRQLPVQAMQSLPILLATNPLAIPKISMQMILLDALANGADAASYLKTVGRTLTRLEVDEAKRLVKDWESSGFEAAVDANSLIRDQMGSLVDKTLYGKAKAVAAKPLDIAQKFGFNAGENILMRSVWLSEYDLLKKSGKVIDAEALENLNARVRNLTLNMNKAGELPYNENTFSAALQFFQAPHKAFSQILLGHTGLSTVDRVKLGTSYVLTYGTGGGYLTNMIMSKIGEQNTETRELVEGGLFNLSLNATLSTLFKEEVRTDFSDSLRLLEAPDIFKFFTGILKGEVGEILSNSPSASLILGDNPRITNFVRQMLRPFIVDNEMKAEELQLAGRSFLNIFSGTSNFMKAMYILEHQKSMSAKGVTIDYHVSDIEALMKIAGFSTIDEIQYYATQDALYRSSQKYKDDIAVIINETSARLANQGISNEDANWTMKMMSEAQRVFKNDPFYMEEFSNQIYYKAGAGEYSLYTRLKSMSGWMDGPEWEKEVLRSNLPDDAKDTLLRAKKMFGEING
jgi:hypothetical protein